MQYFCSLLVVLTLLADVARATERIYVGSATGFTDPTERHRVYVYDAASLALVDTIPFLSTAFPVHIEVSSSGHRLYVTASGNGFTHAVYSLDPISGVLRWLFPDTAHDDYAATFLHNDGQWLMFGRNIISVEDGSLVGRLPDYVQPFQGPKGGTHILVASPIGGPWLLDTLRVLAGR